MKRDKISLYKPTDGLGVIAGINQSLKDADG
jgi:hypothetical protein